MTTGKNSESRPSAKKDKDLQMLRSFDLIRKNIEKAKKSKRKSKS